VVDALSFLVSALGLTAIRVRPPVDANPKTEPIMRRPRPLESPRPFTIMGVLALGLAGLVFIASKSRRRRSANERNTGRRMSHPRVHSVLPKAMDQGSLDR
jgi:hypothetical protein